MKQFKALMRVWMAGILMVTACAAQAQSVQQNKDVVQAFFRLMFEEHQVEEAVSRYVDRQFVQHNPYLESGSAPLAEYFSLYFEQNPQASAEIKRMIAEGDLVVVHSLLKDGPEDRGQATVDIFRLTNGKIVEHWDVSQEIPENPANTNGMF
ncbi:nuclear transport factor 2 family protein [Bordetella avium]|uniref:SnoaL-like domain-containing protein n=1 Tax=Bordetella avium (strain 197N) TaxID=360910 RepID=Q2KTK8_BORA1|nr:nuclear transport factor 2 family protein [Bordetella avium]AZY50709.1 polyketide cyclase [Bordetella avium]AZY54107.1 polyketide cyclase [Bordetella avium]RIQ15122.1 polyketide cyclase [Bordetella avium]RIQ20081.1 polyketide cyclase [Bordetella avium]RIQ34661.1 polyketide cyclase [Bordetella avium]